MVQNTTTSPKIEVYDKLIPGMPQLYHYGSQGTVLGLKNYKNLWFTNIKYMNDSSEFDEALDFILQVLREDYEIQHFESLRQSGELKSRSIDVFSFSLSQQGDLLSQWRGYCPNGGYSISFFRQGSEETSQLSYLIEKNGFYIGKCVYDIEAKKELIARYIIGYSPAEYENKYGNVPYQGAEGQDRGIAEVMAARMESSRARSAHDYIWNSVFPKITKYAPLLKNKAFHQEEEWRIVATPEKIEIKLREGKSFMIPYLQVPLAEIDQNVDIAHMIVGPTPHKELAMKACDLITNGNTSYSQIPYRNW